MVDCEYRTIQMQCIPNGRLITKHGHNLRPETPLQPNNTHREIQHRRQFNPKFHRLMRSLLNRKGMCHALNQQRRTYFRWSRLGFLRFPDNECSDHKIGFFVASYRDVVSWRDVGGD